MENKFGEKKKNFHNGCCTKTLFTRQAQGSVLGFIQSTVHCSYPIKRSQVLFCFMCFFQMEIQLQDVFGRCCFYRLFLYLHILQEILMLNSTS